MTVHISRASAVIVQRVPTSEVDWFLEWQGNVIKVAEGFEGYCGTDVFQPTAKSPEEWVVVIHFEEDRFLNRWLESPIREEWIQKVKARLGDFDMKTLPDGFGAWFAGASSASGEGPPAWKMAMTVLLALFPTVMVLSIVVGPFTQPLGFSLSMLIGNALSISILQWAVMPVLTKLIAPWLHAKDSRNKAIAFGGPLGIAAALAVLTLIFRKISG